MGRFAGLRLVAMGAASLLAVGCGSQAKLPEAVAGDPTQSALAVTTPVAVPSASPLPALAPYDPVDLVTYEPASPCFEVQINTLIDKVPPACAAVWQAYKVRVVPGQDMLKRTPRFPIVTVPKGVDARLADRLGIAMFRTETFEAFSLLSRQIYIVDGLGQNYLFRQVGIMEQAVAQGDAVSTPLCHFFPTGIRVVPLAHDFATYVHRPDGFLGVKFTFTGPCYATATSRSGQKSELFRFNGQRSVVFVGDIGSGDPLGPVLVLTTFGECDQAVVKATCAQ